MTKLINIIAIALFLVIGIVLIKYKPVYEVYYKDIKLGYINNKNKFEDLINSKLFENESENIAYTNLEEVPIYELKLVDRNEKSSEEDVLVGIKENSDITYFKYAIIVKGKSTETVNNIEEAEDVIKQIKEQQNDDIDISIQKVYTKDINKTENIEIAQVVNNINEDIKEQEKIEASTINGIYLSVNPTSGNITSRYGSRESIRDHTHKGLDIAAKTGTPIKAVADGTVRFAGVMGGYGNLIIISHGNNVETYYGHCSKLYVKQGQKVNAGDLIGAVGSTGNSTGSHLHFEIRLNGVYVNPQQYLYK